MKIKTAAVILCAFATAALIAGAARVAGGAARELPKGILVHSERGIIPFRDYALKADKATDMTAFSVSKAYLSANGVTVRVNRVVTDKNHAEVMGKELLSGTWFGISELARENNYAVIGSDLATELFFSADAAGREIAVDGRTYRISGVCRSGGGFIHDISQDGDPDVYLPYTAAGGGAAEYLFLGGEQGKNLHPGDVRYKVNLALGVDAAGVRISDVGDKANLLKTYPFVFLRLLLAAGLLAVALPAANLTARLVFESETRRIKTYFGLAAALLAFAALLYVLCSLPGVPESFLPDESIFDISHYAARFISEMQATNGGAGSYLDRYALSAFSALSALFSLALTTFALTVVLAFKRFREPRGTEAAKTPDAIEHEGATA